MLVGRGEELARSRAAISAGRSVVLSGPVGIGKSAIVDSLREQFDLRVGQCLPSLSHRPYHPVLHALALAPVALPVSVVAEMVRSRLGDALLVIEDAHWIDPQSLEVLVDLMHSRPVVFTVRPGPDAVAILGVLPVNGSDVIELPALTVDELEKLLERSAPTLERFERRRVATAAGGNPLIAAVLANRELRSGHAPLAELGGREAGAVLEAVIGSLEPHQRRTLAMIGKTPSPFTTEALDGDEMLLGTGLVTVSGGHLEVVEPVVSDLAWKTLDESDRAMVLRRLLHDAKLEVATRADLLLQVGEIDEAFALASEAAAGPLGRAEQALALDIAARAAMALADGPGVALTTNELHRLITAAVEALNDAAEFDTAAELLDAEVSSGLELTAEVAVEMARAAMGRGDRGFRSRVVRRLEPRCEQLTAASPRFASLWRVLVEQPVAGTDMTEVVSVLLAGNASASDYSHAAFLQMRVAIASDPASAQELWEVVQRRSEKDRDATSDLEASRNLVIVYLALGKYDDARTLADACIERAEASGLTAWATEFRIHEVISRFHEGIEHDDDLQWLSSARIAPVRLETRVTAVTALVTLLSDRGAAARSAEMLAPWIEEETLGGFDHMVQAILMWTAAQRSWVVGDLAETVRIARWITEQVPAGFPTLAGTHVVWRWAEFESGAPLTAPDPLGGALPCAALEAEAIRLLDDGKYLPAARKFDEAAAEWSKLLRRCALRCRWGEALALTRAGRRRGVERLTSLDGELDDAGFPALRPRVRSALREAGVGVRSPTASDVAGLSARQAEVLQLVAEGLTTAQIAARLRLSPETVNSHVKAAMQKLGARTRVEAAAVVGLSGR